MLLSDDTGVEHTGLGVEGIDGRVDTELGDTTGKDGGGIEMGEGGGRGGIGQVIGGDVDGLDGGDGSLLGRAGWGKAFPSAGELGGTEEKHAYVMRSCICPISVARVGWYPTADGIRPRRADTSDPAVPGASEKLGTCQERKKTEGRRAHPG